MNMSQLAENVLPMSHSQIDTSDTRTERSNGRVSGQRSRIRTTVNFAKPRLHVGLCIKEK